MNNPRGVIESNQKRVDNLYYKPFPQDQFDDIKKTAIKIWQTYDNSYGYVDEKISRIKNLPNRPGCGMLMVSMFDTQNQILLSNSVMGKTRNSIARRLQAGGLPDKYNYFLKNKRLR